MQGDLMRAFSIMMLLLFSGIAAAAEPPEVTEDGLVRVSSSRKVGVYRAPDVPFAHYQRVIIGPTISIAFRKGWERAHPELDPQDIESIRADFARAFRTELERELVKRADSRRPRIRRRM